MAVRSLENLKQRYNRSAPTGGPGMRPGMGGPRMGPGRGMPFAKGKPKNTKAIVKRLAGYLYPHRFRLVIVLLCMLVSTLSSLIP